MKEGSIRIYRIVRACCIFIFYLFLGLLTNIVSFAQDYVPIRDNKNAGILERKMARYGAIRTSKYGVVRGKIKIDNKDLKAPSSVENTDDVKNKEKFGDPWKENEEMMEAYGVVVSEDDLKEDVRTFKERPSRRNNEMIGLYGVAIPNEPLKADKTEE